MAAAPASAYGPFTMTSSPDPSHESTAGPRITAGTSARSDDGRRPSRLRRAGKALVAFACLSLAAWFVVIPYPWNLRNSNPERTSLMKQRIREAEAEGRTLDVRQEWVPLSDVSPRLVRAILIAEDYRFREHAGIDWVSLAEEVQWTGGDDFSWTSPSDLAALRRALGYVWTNRAEMRGRSTITQQVAKNLYFGTDRSLLRKAMEFVVAGRLEKRLDKDRILELYVNIAEWGPGIFGVEAAAQTYFGRSASELTLDQAAALAGTLPHPRTSNPAHNPGRMLWRKNLILRRMDPALAIPAAPMPLADPLPDLAPGDSLREDGTTGSGVGVFDTLALPDTLVSPDSLAPGDTVGVFDSAAVRDTVRGTTGDSASVTPRPDTVVRDTLVHAGYAPSSPPAPSDRHR